MIQVIVYLLLTPTQWLSLHYQPLKSSWLPITVSETPENIKYNLIKDIFWYIVLQIDAIFFTCQLNNFSYT